MVAYHIFFRNKYSQGGATQNYTLWRKAPFVQSENQIEVPTFSNSFLTRNVATDGVWNIDINDIPYAYCGTSASRTLKIGEKTTATGHKLVKVLPEGNGSTVTLYNDQGFPAFRPDPQYTAKPSTYNIVTEGDFTDNLNFVAGFSGNDGDGQSRAYATFEVNPATSYSVRPTANFYLGDFASPPGTLVDESLASNYIEIDFAANPGQYNAIVTQDISGQFTVTYVTAAVFAMTSASSESATSASNVQLTQLKSQVKILSDLVDAALGVSTTNLSIGRFRGHFRWIQDPSQQDKVLVLLYLRLSMTKRGYNVTTWSVDTPSMDFSHTPDLDTRTVLGDWVSSILELAAVGKAFAGYPWVERILFNPGLTSQAESLSLSPEDLVLPSPQFRCSLKWLEAPPDRIKRIIADQLGSFMLQRGYVAWPAEITNQEVFIDVYHYRRLKIENVRADWQAAYNSLGLLKNYVYQPKVDYIIWNKDTAQNEVNTATKDDLSTTVGPLPIFFGMLDWVGAPSDGVKASITQIIERALNYRGCLTSGATIGERSLGLTFAHAPPYYLERARRDWKSACDTLPPPFRRYIANVRCFPRLKSENGDVSISIFPPVDPAYVGQLTWLEGAPPQTRDIIIQTITNELKHRSYDIGFIDRDSDDLTILFSHRSPSDLATASKDWLSAYNAVEGTLRMFITNPRCEEADTIQQNGRSNSTGPILPVQSSYIGTLNWLEGPNGETKDSIIGQLVKTLWLRGNIIREVQDLAALDTLMIVFERTGGEDLPRAQADWFAAYDSVNGFQRMFITNPQCGVNHEVQTQDVGLPVVSDFVGSLQWLEGPNKETRSDIIRQLKAALSLRGYYFRKPEIDFPDFLALPFFSSQFRTLDQAQKDWLAAFESIQGLQRMFITNPHCYEDSIYEIKDADVAIDGTNGVKDTTISGTAAAAAAPESVPAREEESLESKKRRALALLEREGLVGFGSFVSGT